LPLEELVFSAGGGFLFGAVAGYAIKKDESRLELEGYLLILNSRLRSFYDSQNNFLLTIKLIRAKVIIYHLKNAC
jgi:hypothetical protein